MMDEPDRMLDLPPSSLERALIDEGRSYTGPKDLRAHTLAALGLAGSAGVATGGLLAWLTAKTWTTKLLLAMSTLTMLAAIPVSYFLFGHGPEPERLTPTPATPAREPPAAVVPTPPAQVEAPAPVPLVASPTTPPAATARPSASASSALRAELAALDAVRSTLANDDHGGALSFLDAYFRTFPRGRLRLEAEVLRIDALAKGGRLTAAKKYAQEFLKHNPNSVLTARVQPYADR